MCFLAELKQQTTIDVNSNKDDERIDPLTTSKLYVHICKLEPVGSFFTSKKKKIERGLPCIIELAQVYKRGIGG